MSSAPPIHPLLPIVGDDLEVPLVTGEKVGYANLDLAASAPSLRAVADRVQDLLPYHASVHRGAGYASQVCTDAYESARLDVATFVGARSDDVVQFVRNTTDALNLLATAVPGAVIHLDLEHHANLLPWQASGARAVVARNSIPATLAAIDAELRRAPTALLAVTGASNVTGEILPLRELAEIAHHHGARIAVDGAQLVPHRHIDLTDLEIDYLAFSGHKLYAPFGSGVLVGRRDWLAAAPPYIAGGGAVRRVTLQQTTWTSVPARHEGGTPNLLGAAAIAAAAKTLGGLPEGRLVEHEAALTRRLLDGLSAIPEVRTLSLWGKESERIGVATFTVEGYPSDLVAQYLSAEHGIGVRDGRFCAHPLLDRLLGNQKETAVRASVGVGTSSTDVDRLISAVQQLVDEGPAWTYARTPEGLVPTPDPRIYP